MLDTVKAQIQLTKSQHTRILTQTSDGDRFQWVKYNLKSGELRLVRIFGLAETDQNSYHREIRWDVSPNFYPDNCFLTVELSLPKLWYGDNVRLLHEPQKALKLLWGFLNKSFGLKGRGKLAHYDQWGVTRLDCCYVWRFPSQELAQHFLDGLKSQRFPWKQPTIRATSISFTGGSHSTYSAKFYLKLPEFLNHDAREMKKAKVDLAEIRFRELLATGKLRFEVTLRQKWLRRNDIKTFSDVLYPVKKVHFDDDMVKALMPCFDPDLTMAVVFSYWAQMNNIDGSKAGSGDETPIKDGDYFSIPAGDFWIGNRLYKHPGGGFTLQIVENRPIQILKEMLEKMVGSEARLGIADRVREKLLQHYKTATAANLTAFWLYVQKFGSESAKEVYGKQPYYYKLRQLRKAGVSLLEQSTNAVIVGKDFFNSFALVIPSEHVGNEVDDDRDGINVLNITDHLNKTG